jgi:thiamine biosynthesis protein ThiS
MEIVINGEPAQAPDGCTLLDLLRSMSIDPSRVAVELNGSIVRKSEWPQTSLAQGAKLEVVHFVGGGK